MQKKIKNQTGGKTDHFQVKYPHKKKIISKKQNCIKKNQKIFLFFEKCGKYRLPAVKKPQGKRGFSEAAKYVFSLFKPENK